MNSEYINSKLSRNEITSSHYECEINPNNKNQQIINNSIQNFNQILQYFTEEGNGKKYCFLGSNHKKTNSMFRNKNLFKQNFKTPAKIIEDAYLKTPLRAFNENRKIPKTEEEKEKLLIFNKCIKAKNSLS